MKTWPYDQKRVDENKAGFKNITEKQIEYIFFLSSMKRTTIAMSGIM